jgi:hypothetical protein
MSLLQYWEERHEEELRTSPHSKSTSRAMSSPLIIAFGATSKIVPGAEGSMVGYGTDRGSVEELFSLKR